MTEPALHKDPTAEKKADLNVQIKQAEIVEAKTVPGATTLALRSSMIDESELEKQNPQYKYRYINTRDPQKVLSWKQKGYEIVPADQGGRRLGDEMILVRTSRENHEAHRKRIADLGKARLEAHKTEFNQTVEAVVKELKDRGYDIDARKITKE